MPMPKTITKVNKNGVSFTSNVDAIQYTIAELSKAALRDVGKYLRKKVKAQAPARPGSGALRASVFTWVRINKDTGRPELHIGVYSRQAAKKKGKKFAFYAKWQELGTSKMRAANGGSGYLRATVKNEVDTIRNIQAQYLSGINKNPEFLIEEGDFEEDDVGT